MGGGSREVDFAVLVFFIFTPHICLVIQSLEDRSLCMDFELYLLIILRSRSFNALIAPRELFIQALNRNLNLQRFKVFYMTGNYSAILSRLDRRFEALEIRRGFTVFQLMTILEEAHHSLIFVEHDPLLYEDAQEMTEYVSRAMR